MFLDTHLEQPAKRASTWREVTQRSRRNLSSEASFLSKGSVWSQNKGGSNCYQCLPEHYLKSRFLSDIKKEELVLHSPVIHRHGLHADKLKTQYALHCQAHHLQCRVPCNASAPIQHTLSRGSFNMRCIKAVMNSMALHVKTGSRVPWGRSAAHSFIAKTLDTEGRTQASGQRNPVRVRLDVQER